MQTRGEDRAQGLGDETGNAGDGGVQTVRQDDATRDVSGRDGASGAVGCAVCLIAPFYPKRETGRPPVGLERMLRIYFLQQWFNLSDPAVEEALYDSPAMRAFVGIDLGRERCRTKPPCAASATCWRSMIWAGGCSRKSAASGREGLKVATGTIVDATIIAAPRPRPRTPTRRATPRCTRPRRATSGTSA